MKIVMNTDACVLFATELYGVPILAPLAQAAAVRGQVCAWVVPDSVAAHLPPGARQLRCMAEVRELAPAAVYSASNWVPPAFPGTKVQVFHGFNAEKREPGRGHFRLRGFFDLYCTQGPATTVPFRELAAIHRYFAVEETGWPKLDPLFRAETPAVQALRAASAGRPRVMFASTFTPALSAAPALFDQIARMVASGEWYWLLTLHPKCAPELVARYRALAEANPRHAVFLGAEHLLDLQRAGDVLLCDTSSVIDEFAVQLKPVVTFRNRRPKPFMLDVREADAVEPTLRAALQPASELHDALRTHAEAIHPWRDGHSSERVLDAARRFAAGGYGPLARKPRNLWRRLQARRDLRDLLPS